MAQETYIVVGSAGVVSPINGTIRKIWSLLAAATTLKFGFDPAGVTNVVQVTGGNVTNDTFVSLDVNIPVKVGQKMYAQTADVTISVS